MIRGLLAKPYAAGGNIILWDSVSAQEESVTLLRVRSELVTSAAPWALSGDPLVLLLGPRRVVVQIPPGTNTPQELQEALLAQKIVSQQDGDFLRLLNLTYSGGTFRGIGPTAAALGIDHEAPIATYVASGISDSFQAVDEYRSFVDPLGLPGDAYMVSTASGLCTVTVRQGDVPVATLECHLVGPTGEPRQGLRVTVHEVPPRETDPNLVEPDEVNRYVSWQASARPRETVYMGPEVQGSVRVEVVQSGPDGRVRVPVVRGSRVWVEFDDLGFGLAVDIPLDVTFVDLNTLQEFRRTAMLGPRDTR